MFTDIVGYTALMGKDEDKAFDMLRRNHSLHQDQIKKHNGKLIKEIGDGTLASFSLASNAVRCAIDIQRESKDQNIPLKIGIHEGEMVFAGTDVIGDSVNIAARLQELTEEGCITISAVVYGNTSQVLIIIGWWICRKGDYKLKSPFFHRPLPIIYIHHIAGW
jgi:class 3 adenylate cyclase